MIQIEFAFRINYKHQNLSQDRNTQISPKGAILEPPLLNVPTSVRRRRFVAVRRSMNAAVRSLDAIVHCASKKAEAAADGSCCDREQRGRPCWKLEVGRSGGREDGSGTHPCIWTSGSGRKSTWNHYHHTDRTQHHHGMAPLAAALVSSLALLL